MHMGHFIDYIYLLKGLAVEGFDTGLEGIVDLLVALSDSGVYDLVGWETAVIFFFCMNDDQTVLFKIANVITE